MAPKLMHVICDVTETSRKQHNIDKLARKATRKQQGSMNVDWIAIVRYIQSLSEPEAKALYEQILHLTQGGQAVVPASIQLAASNYQQQQQQQQQRQLSQQQRSQSARSRTNSVAQHVQEEEADEGIGLTQAHNRMAMRPGSSGRSVSQQHQHQHQNHQQADYLAHQQHQIQSNDQLDMQLPSRGSAGPARTMLVSL
jgi:hypothetical protein